MQIRANTANLNLTSFISKEIVAVCRLLKIIGILRHNLKHCRIYFLATLFLLELIQTQSPHIYNQSSQYFHNILYYTCSINLDNKNFKVSFTKIQLNPSSFEKGPAGLTFQAGA